MNDLLNSLLDRTIKSGPSIRPRLPSAFEPASERLEPGVPLLSRASDAEALEVVVETDSRAPAPAVLTPKREPTKSNPASLDHVEESATPELSSRTHVTKPAVPDEVQVIREIVANVTQPQLANTAVDRLRDQTLDSAITSLLAPPSNAEPLLEPQTQSPAQPRSLPAEIVEEREVTPKSAREAAREIKARVVKVSLPDKVQQKGVLETIEPTADEPPVVETSNQKPLIQSTVQPRLEPKVVYPAVQQLKSERIVEQLVNVTIGRVEVRATPVATSRFRSEKQTTTSLDDYLRQHHPGGRGAGV